MNNQIYVGNLSRSSSENDLREAFAPYGTVERANLIMDRFTNQSRGFGFVTMSTDEEAQKAIQGLSGQMLGGRPLTVNVARPREERPAGERRSFGGGGYRS